ncbi:Re/Si-specific NAD(P)(+) transhydrogenase subunit alpha [Methylacidimicrobium sp. B4]|uniref:Re/Si-specific NAD(P)(+) transhydrogenase subunit alpha n=1 Tax=Methylacidimicrobium sp. B4 TaxID=2796139 RepID=UPI001A8F036F|nr:Re/Si-specific NAD(P)(+) transhydrogenase subunit alpha [Methylacidimicrobium sp. B4]QSR83937.1 Re/Si-specific NAD(P)(+) transhydrogenase subunit alpha [Methylacidimicrobium sp. B4]
MILATCRETLPGENRVSFIPEGIPALTKLGFEVMLESGAGEAAGFSDHAYQEKGARLESRGEVLRQAQILCQFHAPSSGDIEALSPGAVVLSLLYPLSRLPLVEEMAKRGLTVFALDLLPRISRAQSMDVLSSQSTVAGYRAIVLAASSLPRFFPMLMTPAGTIPPARVFVIGAGVAGLQAIATARRLGAAVEAHDVRPVAKEQVESLGAKFVGLEMEREKAEDRSGYAKAQSEEFLRRQRELIATQCQKADVVVTTALIPGRRAPVLISKEAVARMRTGSVIVDLAAEQGGNCELTEPGLTVVRSGVTLHGPLNPASGLAPQASLFYSKNLQAFLALLVKDGAVQIQPEDPIFEQTLICRDGQIVHEAVRKAREAARPASAA